MVTTVNTQALAGLLLRPAEWADTGAKSQPAPEDPPAAVVKISPEGARQAEVAAQAAPSTQQLQVAPDGGSNVPVAPQQSEAAAPETPDAPPAAANGGGAPRSAAPAGSQAPAGTADGGSVAVSTASVSSTNQTYVPADTDEDGQVSPLEQTAYEAKLAAEKQAQALANAPRATEADAAVKTYAAVEQLGSAG